MLVAVMLALPLEALHVLPLVLLQLLLLLLLLLFRFVLVRENIPSFMPPLLPERLLLAGKSVLYSQ